MPDPSFFFSEVLMDAAFSTYLFIVYFPHLIVSFKKAGILSLTSFFLLFYLTAFSLFPLSFLAVEKFQAFKTPWKTDDEHPFAICPSPKFNNC